MPQKHDLGRRKRRKNGQAALSSYTASRLEAMAWALVRTGKASPQILTTTRHLYRRPEHD